MTLTELAYQVAASGVDQAPIVPAPDALVFDAKRLRNEVCATPAVRVRDDIWPLHWMDHSETADSLNVLWSTVPTASHSAAKTWLFNVINTPPQTHTLFLRAPNPAPTGTYHLFGALRSMMEWSVARGGYPANPLAAMPWDEWAHEVDHLDISFTTKNIFLLHATRLWVHNAGLPTDLNISQPPWAGRKFTQWIGTAPSSIENKTAPIPQHVMGPLLTASMTIVDEFLALRSLPRGFSAGDVRCATAIVIAYLTGMRPKELWHLEQDCLTIVEEPNGSLRYCVYGREFKNVRHEDGSFNSAGRLRETPWITIEPVARAIDAARLLANQIDSNATRLFPRVYNRPKTDQSRSRLGAIRPSSTLNFRRFIQMWNRRADLDGSLARIPLEHDATAVDSTLPPGGIEARQQSPARTVMTFTEGIDEYLAGQRWSDKYLRDVRVALWQLRAFESAHTPGAWGGRPLRSFSAQDLDDLHAHLRSRYSPAWASSVFRHAESIIHAAHPVDDEVFPVTLSRLRRTLAWFIANQPGGEIALGVQYGHMRLVTGMGYAGTAESGFPQELEMETILVGFNDLEEYVLEIQNGSVVSGPAASRLLEASDTFRMHFAGTVMTERGLRDYKRANLNLVHDNERAHVVCVYDSKLALCHPDRDHVADRIRATPALDNCKSACPNRALLDRHANAMQRELDVLHAEAPHLPLPMQARNERQIAWLQREIGLHISANEQES